VARHEILRTTFALRDGAPVQVIHPPAPVTLPVVDLRALDAAARDAELRRRARAIAEAPFSLGAGPLFRAGLLRLADDEHVLLLVVHHIAADGWSMGIIVDEL